MYTFEHHITIANMNTEEFKSRCKEAKAKPIFIQEDSGSNFVDQLMTSKFHKAENLDGGLAGLYSTAMMFPAKNIIRRKLEVIVGKEKNLENIFPVQYREYHSKFEVTNEKIGDFEKIVRQNRMHSSVNSFKPGFRFVTTRSLSDQTRIVGQLKKVGFNLINTICEYVVFDDNPTFDKGWTGCYDLV